LYFDAERKLIEGVPQIDDVGKTVQIAVSITEKSDNDLQQMLTYTDTFEIRVAEESSNIVERDVSSLSDAISDDTAPRSIRCLPGTAVTTATLVVDADVMRMTGAERSQMLKAIAAHLELPVSGLRLTAASGNTPIDDGSALVAGAGNVPSTSTDESRPKTLVQWEVGCGNVFSAHMAVLQRVETTALDGSMASAIGRGVIGWHVANKKPASALRLRRQVPRVIATATPTVSIAPPTRQPVPTRTVQDPQPTVVVTVPAVVTRPTTKPPKTKPTTTARPTKPPKTTKERVQRQTTLRTTTVTTVPSTRPTSRATERLVKELEPSVVTKIATTTTDAPTPPLVITKATVTMYPPLTWTGMFRRLDVSVNEIVNVELPSNAFEGGAPGRLTLQLLTEDGLSASLSWLKLNGSSGRLYGMPMESQVGLRDYIIVATDAAKMTARGTFSTEVSIRPKVAYPAFISSAAFDLDFDTFCENDTLRLDVANKLGRAFGDPDARNLAITRVVKGSVILAWTNSSMTGETDCPDEELNAVQSKMFNSDGTIRSSFSEAIQPYRLLSVQMTKRESCGTDSIRATPGVAPVVARSEPPPRESAKSTVSPDSPPKVAQGSNATVIIIVLIVIAIVIIVTIIVCCIVCRRRNRSKSESPDKKSKQGVPIILAYELHDMDSLSGTPSKPLIGTGAEKPPAPPNYQLATGTNGTAPSSDHRQPLLASNSAADQMSPLKFQPPPGTSSARGQQASGQRRPPAYTNAT